MYNKYLKLLISLFIATLSVLIILLTPINNGIIPTVLYIIFSFYMMSYYYSNLKLTYMYQLYLFWVLISILVNIFSFGLTNIITTIVMGIFILIQYFKQEKKKKILILEAKKKKNDANRKIQEKTKIIKKEQVKIPNFLEEDDFEKLSKELYLDMQKYFMELEYNKLESILDNNIYNQFKKQMEHLEKTNRRAIRENIEIFDYKINEYHNNDNKLFVSINIGVYEDKYTVNVDNMDSAKKTSYESYYEVEYVKDSNWKITNLKLIYSHSKKLD